MINRWGNLAAQWIGEVAQGIDLQRQRKPMLKLNTPKIGWSIELNDQSIKSAVRVAFIRLVWNRLTVMDLVSIFLIIAIAADDILLLYNTYQLAPAMLVVDDGSQLSPAEKMRQALSWSHSKTALQAGVPPRKLSWFITPITMGYRWIYDMIWYDMIWYIYIYIYS